MHRRRGGLSVHGDADGIVDISLGQRLFHAAHHSVNGGRNALPTQAWPRKLGGSTNEFLRVAAGHETALDTLLRAGDPAVAYVPRRRRQRVVRAGRRAGRRDRRHADGARAAAARND